MVIMYFIEMRLRIPAIKEDSNLSSEIKLMLIKKAKRDFYSVLLVLFMMMSMFIFAYFRIFSHINDKTLLFDKKHVLLTLNGDTYEVLSYAD